MDSVEGRFLVLLTLIALTSGFLALLRRENERSPKTGIPWWQNRSLPGRRLVIGVWVLVLGGIVAAALGAGSGEDDPLLVGAIAATAVVVMIVIASALGRWRR